MSDPMTPPPVPFGEIAGLLHTLADAQMINCGDGRYLATAESKEIRAAASSLEAWGAVLADLPNSKDPKYDRSGGYAVDCMDFVARLSHDIRTPLGAISMASELITMRAAADRKEVRVEYNALIQQLSGEDWNDIELTLSTASPSRATWR